MKELKAPNRLKTSKTIFLAGSIEMGKAVNWQQEVVNRLSKKDVIIYNPRRDDWDSSWEQTKENKQFREQVEWELEMQEKADVIFMYFDENTKAPITLLELGLFAHTGKLMVCCPDKFYRKGNVDIVCERYGVEQVDSINEFVNKFK